MRFYVKVFSSKHQLTVESNLHQLEPSYVWFEWEASDAWSVLTVFMQVDLVKVGGIS